MTMRSFNSYFGEPWPSGTGLRLVGHIVCEDGVQVPTPVGELCALCDEPIGENDRGDFIGNGGIWPDRPHLVPSHVECGYRTVMGGIGHLKDHAYWCKEMGDPDAGLTYRQSALEVWDWGKTHTHGEIPAGEP
jgi:hypothetical protein